MNKSNKPEMKDSTKKGRKLELEELKIVTGGVSSGCPERNTYKCTQSPFTCSYTGEHKDRCTFG